jgi:two-component system, OmpR family, response regulator CpxR
MNNRSKPVGLRVLCIDDDSHVLELEKSILEAAGYQVFLASSGAEGLNLAKRCAVDLVVLDYEMPRMVGTEVAQRLRTIHPALPIIMVSGTEPEETSRIVDLFIPKTNMSKSLAEEVDRFLRQRQADSKR